MTPPNTPNPTTNRTSNPLSTASHLTRRELLCRRLHNIKRLTKYYRRLYWDLMEQVRIKHTQYVLQTGLSPFVEPDVVVVDNYSNICNFDGCHFNSMPATKFCFQHILSDPKQQLYKPCTFVISRSAAGAVTCKKPIMRSTTPSYCTVHMKKAEMHLAMALKKEGMNISLLDKVSPKFHQLVPEFIRQIQAKRKAMRGKEGKTVHKKECETVVKEEDECKGEVKKEEDAKECKTEVTKGDDIAEG